MGTVIKASAPHERRVPVVRWCSHCGLPGSDHAPDCPQGASGRELAYWEEWHDWHLSLTGWRNGNSKGVEPAVQIRPPPRDRVLTLRTRAFLNRADTVIAPTLLIWCARSPGEALCEWARHGMPPDAWISDRYRDLVRRIRERRLDLVPTGGALGVD
jgi:hypothetical protein